jgi:hypothetical protein
LNDAAIARKAREVLPRRAFAVLLAACVLGGAVAAIASAAVFFGSAATISACATTADAAGFTPITGIIIRSESLVAGYGCGRTPAREGGLGVQMPGQVYRYLAIVSYLNDDGSLGARVTWGVFDCFVDAQFNSLPSSPTGGTRYRLDVFAFDVTSYPAGLDCYVNATDQQCIPNAYAPDGALLFDLGYPDTFESAAKYMTTCTATQQQGISVLADCDPLSPRPTRISIDTTSFPLIDGGTVACGPNYDQATAFYAAADAGLSGQSGLIECTKPILIDAVPGASYTMHVNLQNSRAEGGAAVVAIVDCTATAQAYATVNATCGTAHGP